VDLQLLDHVPYMPLNRVRRDTKTMRHRNRVQSLRQQLQDLELPGCELCSDPRAVPLPGIALGAAFGAAFGVLLGNLTFGVAIGVVAGLLVGTLADLQQKA
jgi:hypothetical protein